MKLSDVNLKVLEVKGVRPPKKAYSYDYVLGNKGKEFYDICTFWDINNLPVKRIKTKFNAETNETTVQARFYHYLGDFGPKRKLKEINQHEFNSENECVGATDWRFYHNKDGKVRFSMNKDGRKKHNFIQANGVYTDRNGITFRPVSIAEYLDTKRDIGKRKFVDEPWTYLQSLTADEAATDAIQECTAVGIIGKKGISLNHFNPNNPINLTPYAEGNTLSGQLLEQGEDAKVFLMGACDSDYNSRIEFNQLAKFFQCKNVEASKYKTGNSRLELDFDELSRSERSDRIRLRDGRITPFYFQSGQHIAYKNGEVKLSNLIIDRELEKGNLNPADLIDKSFEHYDK
ncbi:MAG: hypothetical protein K6E29_07385 [Cyanobacteria bacterium RUI128]|nr:hypothetical protein [Cyanobacteria bacterium RUI128]